MSPRGRMRRFAKSTDRRRGTAAGIAVLLLALLSPGILAAREIVRERFERLPPGVSADNAVVGKDGVRGGFSRAEREFRLLKGGPAIDLPVSIDNGNRGSISFDLQRKAGNIPPERRTVFEFLDPDGKQLMLAQIQWSSGFEPRLPAFFLKGQEYIRNSLGLWGTEILLDREVSVGQWIHVDLAWDDALKRYFLWVDGRPQDVEAKQYDPKTGSVRPDFRSSPDTERAKGKAPALFHAKPFGYFISRLRTIRIGVNSHARTPYAAGSPLSNSVLDNFVVRGDEWPPDLGVKPVIDSVTDDSFRVAGISGKLAAGDKVSVEMNALPGGAASFDMGTAEGLPMVEVPASGGGPGIPAVEKGTYRGSYVIRPGDYFEDGRIVGRFVSADNVPATPVSSGSKWTIDARSRFSMVIDRPDLPADSGSTARVKVKVADVNGNPVPDHLVKVTLSTTDEYTGLAGGGSARSRDAAQAARDALGGAEVETRWKGTTDRWGEVDFDFTSGFAAKTILLQAKDMTSGDVGVDFITSYKEAAIDIALTPPVNRAAARRGLQYLLKVEATRTELTADGRSRSVVRATLFDPAGKGVAGDPVAFTLSSTNGTLRTIAGTTDSSGTATAEYTAGKKIGIVVVTATATLRNATGSVSITLLSDAPAKILLKARPATLPADGVSRADLQVKVTDINDNPNKDTRVEFRLARGSGRLEYADRTTDRFGDASNRFTAGSISGIATILATVRSRVPTDAELAKARNVLFVPYSDLGDEIKVRKWLKKPGETALKGEAIVEYTIGRRGEARSLAAPYDCRIDFLHVEYWDTARTGDTLASVTRVTVPGSGYTPSALPVQAPRRR